MPLSPVPLLHSHPFGGFGFSASDGTNGFELWKSDGTATGTVMVKNIRSGGSSSAPEWLTDVDGTLYFSANDGVNGEELWKSDGTATGTVMAANLLSGGSSASPERLKAIHDAANQLTLLFFTAYDFSTGRELWMAIFNANPTADLSVTKTDDPDPVFTDDPLEYTVSIANAGPGAATAVEVIDTVPTGAIVVSATTTKGGCNGFEGSVTCNIIILASGENATATIKIYTPQATGTIFNFVNVTSSESDPVPANNTTTEETQVVDPPAIADLKIDSLVKTRFEEVPAI